MKPACSRISAGILLILLGLVWLRCAHAQIAFTSPAEHSMLSKATILSGTCTGSKHVVLNGPGIAKNKTISCQKNDKRSNSWSYPLTNAFKDMPDGMIAVTAAQGAERAARAFTKVTSGSSAAPARCYLNGHNIDTGKSIKAFQSGKVA